ncbi:FHA domain-containing protein [Photobacterium swingsii]|uniref:type VI secretion system-associated FHA domain protein n=1 Tax=Photobacterium swingsii TaxID=680026 RepID=UPI003D1400B0
MPLSLRIISSPDGEPITAWAHNFPDEGGSIGRAFGSTMQLSDASREISGTHALISRGSRGYQIMDVSTNGLFINGSHEPLGRNNQSTLSDGDVLNLGKYRVMVSCFIPEKAQAKQSQPLDEPLLNGWEDDPFGVELPSVKTHLEAVPDEANRFEQVLSFTAASQDSVIEDPFLTKEPEVVLDSTLQTTSVFQDDGFDDDPFVDDSMSQLTSIPREQQRGTLQERQQVGTSVSSPSMLDPQQLMIFQAKQQELMMQAAEMALERLLTDIAPASLEGLFDDLAPKRFWGKKSDYWSMYQRYYARQQDNNEWQMKFKAYFAESLRIKQTFGDK